MHGMQKPPHTHKLGVPCCNLDLNGSQQPPIATRHLKPNYNTKPPSSQTQIM